MSITIQDHIFYIHTQNSSLILTKRDDYIMLSHYGKRIERYHHSNRIHDKDHAFSGNPVSTNRTFSLDTQRQILGQHGLGDFREPLIKIQHHQNSVTNFKFVEANILVSAPYSNVLPSPHSTSETLQLIFDDIVAGLRMSIYYSAYDQEDTITTFSTIENIGTDSVVLHRAYSAQLDVPNKAYDVLTLQGAYAREKTLRKQEVTQGIFSIESTRGASGHAQTPALMLADKGTTEDNGNVFAIQLMYSGNFRAFVQKNQLNEVRLGIGINDDNFSWELKSGEAFQTPVALLTFSSEGFTGLTHLSHNFIQSHIVPKQFNSTLRPILINNWEATYFDFTKEKILDIVEEASNLGMELFVLDDGWFGNRFDDNRALGDWYVNETKMSGPLSQLIEEVHTKGMKFGLWVEPEMISEDSDLYRLHPEWVIQVPQRAHTYSRNQLVLNYANPAVVSNMKKLLDTLLSTHDIDYIKWDMNRNITNIGNGHTYVDTQMQSHAYMLGLYDLVSYLTNKHANILFESCSGGGGRNDLGMMRYFPQVWASDNTDAICRLSIQYGSSYLYPTMSQGAHVSAVPNHQVNRQTPIKTRGDVAMMGNLGYELDLTQLTPEEKQVVKAQIDTYKVIRPIVQLGKQYRLINPDNGSNESAVQFNYQDETVVTYVRILSTVEEIETTLYLKGLDAHAMYQELNTGEYYSGSELMYAGLTVVMPTGDYLSRQYRFKKI